MKRICIKVYGVFMLLCVCLSAPLFTSCYEDIDKNYLKGYWVPHDYASKWGEIINKEVAKCKQCSTYINYGLKPKYEEHGPYELTWDDGTYWNYVGPNTAKHIRFVDNNIATYVDYTAHCVPKDNAIATLSVDGSTFYIVPEFKGSIGYVVVENIITFIDKGIYTMSSGLLYYGGTPLVKLKEDNE